MKEGLKYVNHLKQNDDFLRESIPLYDLIFQFFSSFPFDDNC
jgi:hypothetical protein